MSEGPEKWDARAGDGNDVTENGQRQQPYCRETRWSSNSHEGVYKSGLEVADRPRHRRGFTNDGTQTPVSGLNAATPLPFASVELMHAEDRDAVPDHFDQSCPAQLGTPG